MIFEIDLKFLIQHRITAHQFIIVKLLSAKKYIMLKQYIAYVNGLHTIENDLRSLKSAGFIDKEYNVSNIIHYESIPIADSFFKTQTVNESAFEELYNLYPTKVIRPDGTSDYLRSDKDRCRKLYNNIIFNNPQLHNRILQCLQAEIDDKTNNGKLSYMKRLSSWLNSESWKAYDVFEDETTSANKIQKYGTDIE